MERRLAAFADSSGFGLLFDQIDSMACTLDLDGRITLVNRAGEALTGYTTAELLGMQAIELVAPERRAAAVDQFRRRLVRSRRAPDESILVHKDGARVPVSVTSTLIFEDGVGLTGVLGIVSDLRERRRAERNEMTLAEAQRMAGIGSWFIEVGTRKGTWSEEACRIYGLPLHADLDMFLDRVHPDDRARLNAVVEKASRANEPYEIEYRVVLPDGETRWVDSRASAVCEGDRLLGYRGTAQDVTERRRAEEQYRTLVEHLPLTMFTRPMTVHGTNLFVSRQVEEMLGYTVEDWMSDPDMINKSIHPDDVGRVVEAVTRLREHGEPMDLEYRFLAPDGRVIWVEDVSYVVRDDAGKPLFVQGFLLDISARRQAEADRDQLREELYQAQKLEAVGRLAGGVAHDFNNMLTAIKGYGQLLLDSLEPGTDTHAEAAQILRAVEQASALPRQLLAFSRNQTLEPQPVDLNEVVATASGLLRRLIGERIELDVSLRARDSVALLDAAQFENVLVNLALNARDAMPDGGTLAITTDDVEVDAATAAEHKARPGAYVLVEIADTGQGMDADTKAHAFEPFFTTKGLGDGTGLGLSTVYGLVNQSGGFIVLDSAPTSGSTFSLHFPCAGEAAESRVDGDEGAQRVRPEGAPRTVLLAEDEELVRGLVARILEEGGFAVHSAASGEDALALHDGLDGAVDVLVTDMAMPGMSGRALARRLRERHPRIPIVLMSGYTEEAPALDSDDDVGVTFLEKPFSPAALIKAIDAVVAQAEG
jgi:two-component system, cell cycle sensor histidine kinase and response regulator CckA